MGALTVAETGLPLRPTTSLLKSKSAEAKALLSTTTTPAQATKAAKELVGGFASLRVDDPAAFIRQVAAVMAEYPLGVILECCDPRRGLARKVEFLSIRSLSEWLDQRMAFYCGLAKWQEREEQAPRPELGPEDCAKGLMAWRGLQMTIARGEIEAARALTFDQAATVGAADLDKPVRIMIPAMRPQSKDLGNP